MAFDESVSYALSCIGGANLTLKDKEKKALIHHLRWS